MSNQTAEREGRLEAQPAQMILACINTGQTEEKQSRNDREYKKKLGATLGWMREPDDAKISSPVLGGAGRGEAPMPTQQDPKMEK